MTHRRLSSFGANSVELRAALAAEHTFDHAERMTEYGESGGDDPRPEHGGSRGDDPRPGEPLGARYLGPDFSKLSGAAQFRGPDFSKLVGAQFRFPDYSKLIGATQFGGPDLSKLVGGSTLVNGFSNPLSSMPLIQAAIDDQNKKLKNGQLNDTGVTPENFNPGPGNGTGTIDNNTYHNLILPQLKFFKG